MPTLQEASSSAKDKELVNQLSAMMQSSVYMTSQLCEQGNAMTQKLVALGKTKYAIVDAGASEQNMAMAEKSLDISFPRQSSVLCLTVSHHQYI